MNLFINAGDLRDRVLHQTYSKSQDALAHTVETWRSVATYWAFVQPLLGRELLVAQQLKPEVSHKVTMRFVGTDDPIKPNDRLLYKTRTLSIESVVNIDERNHTYSLICIEVFNLSVGTVVLGHGSLVLQGYGTGNGIMTGGLGS